MLATGGLVAVLGCAKTAAPDLDLLYSRQALDRGAKRNPVIVIPGIGASRLIERSTGRVVWNPRARRAAAHDDERALLAALPMGEGAPLRSLLDDLHPAATKEGRSSGAADGAYGAGPYDDLIAALRLGGYRFETPGQGGEGGAGAPSGFRFAYDWRRDLVEGAAYLHEFLLEKRELVRAARQSEGVRTGEPIRFDAVAHSTGGLLLRYYLRYGAAELPEEGALPKLDWAGARLVGRAVLVGTPNAGAAGALLDLVHGEGDGWFLPPAAPPLLGTLPAAYQMLPRGRHKGVLRVHGRSRLPLDDLFDPVVWEGLGWGLASPDHDALLARLLPDEADPVARRRIAIDHLRKCLRRARRFCEALDVPGQPPAALSLHLMAADAVATDAVVAIDWATGRLRVIERRPGDGAVLRSSALLDERAGGEWSPSLLSPIGWDSVQFFSTGGLRLGRDPTFVDNLLFLLLEQPRRARHDSAPSPAGGPRPARIAVESGRGGTP